uniref:Uncharacterized protein n=1 Tax=Oryza rufipogon TaxID=4529 RepID=A0A0E0RHS8_ORYRU
MRRPSEPAQVLPSSFSLHLRRRRRLRRGRTDAAPVVAAARDLQWRQPSSLVSLLSVPCVVVLRPPPSSASSSSGPLHSAHPLHSSLLPKSTAPLRGRQLNSSPDLTV